MSHKLSKEEFVAKALAEQEERKTRLREARDAMFDYFKVRDLRFRRAQGKNRASSYKGQKGGRIR